jgi:hypothetical protein
LKEEGKSPPRPLPKRDFSTLTENRVVEYPVVISIIAGIKTTRVYFHFLAAILSILLSSSASAQLTKLNEGFSAISAEQLPA